MRQEWFRHPGTLALAQPEGIAFAATDIFEILGLPHACRGNTAVQSTVPKRQGNWMIWITETNRQMGSLHFSIITKESNRMASQK